MDSILNINLSNARGKDEDFTTYKNRLRSNKKVLKLYKTYGREAFQAMFPNGVLARPGTPLIVILEATTPAPNKTLLTNCWGV